jgi:hypothetical protein
MLGEWTCHVKVRTFAGHLRTADSIACTSEELGYLERGEKISLVLGGKNIWARAESIFSNRDNAAVDIRAVQIEDDGTPPLHATEPDFEDH